MKENAGMGKRTGILNITESKILIEYSGQNVRYKTEKRGNIPENLLRTVGEYMDAEEDEYAEEIAIFKKRDLAIEYVIKPRIKKTQCNRSLFYRK